MTSDLKTLTALCAVSLCLGTTTAWAGSVTQPGETVGLAAGAPLPEGLYFVNTADWGNRDTVDVSLGVTIPVLAWSTPWTFLGARVQFLGAAPLVEEGIDHTNYLKGVFNPFLGGQLAWDLGNGFGFSYALGAYFGVKSEVAFDSTSLNQRFGLSYTGNSWNLTANVIYGIQFDQLTTTVNPDFVNVDLTATKKIGKWEIGPVAFGSSDVSDPFAGYQRQSQVAIGGLVGYDFGPLTLQTYVTHDVFERNYGGFDTRVWGRVIIPLWTPTPPPPPAPMYHK